MDEKTCRYWVSKSPEGQKAHPCGKAAVVVAQPNAPYLYEQGEDDQGFCQTHATETRLRSLMDTGWTLLWLN